MNNLNILFCINLITNSKSLISKLTETNCFATEIIKGIADFFASRFNVHLFK